MKIRIFLSLALASFCMVSSLAVADQPVSKFRDLLGSISSSPTDTEFLDPETAFSLSANVVDATRINLHWDIADGYYLYRDRFRVDSDTPGIQIINLDIPPGKLKSDPEFGDVYVFYGTVDIVLEIQRQQTEAGIIELTVVSQGCKEDAICYPPQSIKLNLDLPLFSTADNSAIKPAAGEFRSPVHTETIKSRQDQISDSLTSNNIFVNMLVFFGFGLLLSLTPCIFPMIPILSGIIVGQGADIKTRLAFMLSVSYVVMMALTYAVLGIIAGSFQFNLQAAAQNVWAISLFSLVFVLLALSMFGFYELQLPTSWQSRLNRFGNKQQSGSLFGAGIMGVLSAVIVGPCVAPPLAGALIYISHTGNALLGGAALFALGMGMGVPLLIIGTSAGTLLPKAGPWMVSVKKLFGVLMLAVAIWFMGRILPGELTLFLWGVLAIVCGIYMGALEKTEPGNGWTKLLKGLAIVLLIYGGALIIGAAGGARDVFRPLQFSMSEKTEKHGLPFAIIKSEIDLDRALNVARNNHKIVMLDFYADWCITCKEMERYTFTDPEVQVALEDLVLLKADVTANDRIDQDLMKRFDIIGPPAILFFVGGNEVRSYRVVGFVNAADFVKHIKSVKSL